MVNGKLFKTVFLVSILLSFPLFSEKSKIYIRSNAYDLKSGKFIYSENHNEYYRSGQHTYSIVEYKDPKGKVLARKKIEFGKKKTQPDFYLEDFRTGYTDRAELISQASQTFRLQHRRSKNQELKTKSIRVPGNVVVDGGFDYFVRDNFETLSAGKRITGNFVLTNRLDYFQCRVYKSRDLKYKGRDAVQFILQPENFLIRQLADKIIVTYDKKSKRLLEYIGISNIQDNSGDDFPKVKIVFQFKPEELDSGI